jgi:hypothetical protein
MRMVYERWLDTYIGVRRREEQIDVERFGNGLYRIWEILRSNYQRWRPVEEHFNSYTSQLPKRFIDLLRRSLWGSG